MNYSFNVRVTLMNGDQLEFFNVDQFEHTQKQVYLYSKSTRESAGIPTEEVFAVMISSTDHVHGVPFPVTGRWQPVETNKDGNSENTARKLTPIIQLWELRKNDDWMWE